MPTPWSFTWTPDSVRDFWNWRAAHRPTDYFSRVFGASIIEHAAPYLTPRGVVVDVGAGAGYLASMLLVREYRVQAVEDAPVSVDALQERFRHHAGFLGASLGTANLPTGSADAVFAVETIEHLSTDAAITLWRECARLLRGNGVVVITTPFEEHLPDGHICCPSCGAVFHTVQHVRAFTAQAVRAELEGVGYRTLACKAVFFSPLTGLRGRLERLRRWVERQPNPHLFYVGQSRAPGS